MHGRFFANVGVLVECSDGTFYTGVTKNLENVYFNTIIQEVQNTQAKENL